MNKKEKECMVPNLRFPEFEDAEDWSAITLDELAKFRRGSFPQPYGLPKWYDEIDGMPFIQVYDVGDDFRLKTKTKSKISKEGAEQSVFIPKGTVIITIQGSIGRVAITQYDAYIDRTLLLFEEFFTPINKIFFAYVLFLLFEIEKEKAPGGIIKTITKEVLSDFTILVPSLFEQQKIADCLSSLDEYITAESQQLELLKAHKKGLMQQLFPAEGQTVPQLRFAEFRDSGQWETKSLEQLSPAIFDGTHQTPTYIESGVPFFSVENLVSGNKNKFISRDDYLLATSKNKPEKGDILITRIGNIGFSKLVDWDFEFSIYVTLAVIKKSKSFNTYYLHSFFQSAFYQTEIKSKSLLNAVPCKINMDELRKTKVLLPPDKEKKEQQKIADCLSSLDELIAAKAAKIEAMKVHKNGLMQGLFPMLIDNI